MIAEEKAQSLHLVLQSLPEEVRAWLNSEEVGDLITLISQNYLLKDQQLYLLPELLLRLVTSDLEPAAFTAELQRGLGVDETTAKKITSDLKQKVLEPIRQPLGIMGIDLNLLEFRTPLPAPPPPPPLPPPPGRVSQPPTAPTLPNQPFILYQEKALEPVGLVRPILPPTLQLFPKTAGPPAGGATEAPQVQVERIVHYTNLYTPLTRLALKKKAEPKISLPRSRWFI